MATLSPSQIDLTPDEMDSIERWSGFAGFRTKREFVLNAFTLFQWAAKQILLGRTICAIDEATGEVRHLEMPGLAAIASKTRPTILSSEEVRQRLAEPEEPFAEFRTRTTLEETSGDEEVDRAVGRQAKHRAETDPRG